MPDFKEVGYLGDEFSKFGENFRTAHAPAFGLAGAINKIAMHLRLALPLDNLDEPKPYVVTCFARAVESYQCAILMCERGATMSAMQRKLPPISTVRTFGQQYQADLGLSSAPHFEGHRHGVGMQMKCTSG